MAQHSTGESTPIDAATVVLVRAPFEVFLVRRHKKSAFMGGVFVYPGGKLDAQDMTPNALARLPEGAGASWVARLDPTPGRKIDQRLAAALCVAACRELFEEAGVLLARRAHDSGPLALDDRHAEARRALNAGESDFAAFLEREDLVLALDGLIYWSHWITPSREPRRFDTRFFIARHPEGQTPLHDTRETTEQIWLEPAEALQRHFRGDLPLAPPTMRTLEELAAAGSFANLEAAAAVKKVAPILPKLGLVDERIAILLPWDPLYTQAEGDGLPDLEGLAHPQAHGPSRLVLDGERWISH